MIFLNNCIAFYCIFLFFILAKKNSISFLYFFYFSYILLLSFNVSNTQFFFKIYWRKLPTKRNINLYGKNKKKKQIYQWNDVVVVLVLFCFFFCTSCNNNVIKELKEKQSMKYCFSEFFIFLRIKKSKHQLKANIILIESW